MEILYYKHFTRHSLFTLITGPLLPRTTSLRTFPDRHPFYSLVGSDLWSFMVRNLEVFLS